MSESQDNTPQNTAPQDRAEEKNTAQSYNSFNRSKSASKRGAPIVQKTYTYFGLAKSGRTVRLRFLLKGGARVQLSYALLPTIVLQSDQKLIMSTGQIRITITGRGLNTLEEYLAREIVLWIKESETTLDEKHDVVFISEIKIEGNIEM